jgi:hypothetical protein
MSKRLRFTKAEIENAARAASDHSLVVKLEPGGSMIFTPPYLDADARKGAPTSVEEWRRRRNEGKSHGRP